MLEHFYLATVASGFILKSEHNKKEEEESKFLFLPVF